MSEPVLIIYPFSTIINVVRGEEKEGILIIVDFETFIIFVFLNLCGTSWIKICLNLREVTVNMQLEKEKKSDKTTKV